MPSPRAASGRRTEEKGKRSVSFHGKLPSESREPTAALRRPKTQPELFASRRQGESVSRAELLQGPPRLTKLLLNVTVQRSLGHIHIIISPESTVQDLIVAVLRQYLKEGRRPALPFNHSSAFDLHYSQFSLESLDPDAKLIGLGSRNFFLCPKPLTASSSCSDESEKAAKTTSSPWYKFMDFLR